MLNIGVLKISLDSVNGMKTNQLKPVWLMEPKEVDSELHNDFYRKLIHPKCY